MTTRTGRRLATAALGVAGMVLALAAPATAAPEQSTGELTWFEVPGRQLMMGEERTFNVLVRAEEGTASGDLGAATFQLVTQWGSDPIVEANPTDNVASFTVTAVDAA